MGGPLPPESQSSGHCLGDIYRTGATFRGLPFGLVFVLAVPLGFRAAPLGFRAAPLGFRALFWRPFGLYGTLLGPSWQPLVSSVGPLFGISL